MQLWKRHQSAECLLTERMMASELVMEKADYILESARQKPTKLKGLNGSNTKWKSIHQKLADLYLEESVRDPEHKNLRNTSHLLEKLVARDRLNCLIINLYPGNEGYSLMLKSRSGNDTETMRLPYEEGELLQYINNEELPPILVDLLERSQANIFYSGCVIVEIRDYRRSSNPSTYECHHVLLKPNTQTLLCDVNLIASDSSKWTPEDKQILEAQLLLATQEPLCLEPSQTVVLIGNKLQHSRNKFSTVPILKTVKKFSQAAINRKRKFEHFPAPFGLKLYDFLAKRKDHFHPQSTMNLKLGKTVSESWKDTTVELTTPEEIEVEKYAKSIKRIDVTQDNLPVLIEEYILDTEHNQGKTSHCRLTIHQLPIDETFTGELYVDKDYTEGIQKGTTYKFTLGTRDAVDRYIQQFTEIITEEGRKSVRITHMIPGQPPKVTSTQGGQDSQMAYLTTMPQTPSSSPNPSPKPSASKPPLSITTNTIVNSNQTSSPGTLSQPNHSGCPGGSRSHQTIRQVASFVNISGPSTVSQGPINVTSPTQGSGKPAPTPPGSTRTPTPNSTPTPPPQPSPGSRKSSTDSMTTAATSAVTATVTPAAGVGQLGLIGTLQLGLPGIIAGGSDQATGLTPSMSLTGMSVPSGIAVPISLAMMHVNPSMNTPQPSGMIVSSMPGLVGTSALTTTTSCQTASGLVTSVANSGSSVGAPAVIVTSGMLTTPSTMLATPASMLSLPIGMPGSLNQSLTAQLMSAGLKGTTPGLRTTSSSSLSLLQPAISVIGQLPRTGQTVTGAKQTMANTSSTSQRTVTPSPPTGSSQIKGPTPPPPAVSGAPPLLPTLTSQQTILTYQKQQQLAQLQQQQQQVWAANQNASQTHSQPAGSKGKTRKRTAPTPPRDQHSSKGRDGNKK